MERDPRSQNKNMINKDLIKTLPSPKKTLYQFRGEPKKSLGQNFLHDMNIAQKIARLAAPLDQGTIIEIGPGVGTLTRALFLQGASKIISIEKDERMLEVLNPLQQGAGNAFCLHLADALKLELYSMGSTPRQIIANLPYNIATTLLFQWLKTPTAFTQFTLMFQREVAQRIVAVLGDKSYGRLAIFCNWLCYTKMEMLLKPNVFTPSPKVESAVVTLRPRREPLYPCQAQTLSMILKAAFGKRRKMIRQSLKSFPINVDKILKKASISDTKRAEELTIKDFCALAMIFDAGKVLNNTSLKGIAPLIVQKQLSK